MLDCNRSKAILTDIQQTLSVNRHRQLLLITGTETYCVEAANALFDDSAALTLSQSPQFPNASWPQHLHQILGQEWDYVIYDGFSGVIPNMLSAASGTVKAGGFLVVLLPELEHLASFLDPAVERWCSAGHHISQSLFLTRLARLLTHEPCLHLSEQHGFIDRQTTYGQHHQATSFDEQANAVSTMVSAVESKKNLPSVLCADRGRGKSSALGLLAKALPQKQFVLCSANRQSVSNVFRHLGVSDAAASQCNTFKNMTFLPIDRVLAERPHCDVLLVDEAAAIPVSLLLELLSHYPNSVFASTLIGYEGNGRGYTLKFLKKLKSSHPSFQLLELSAPIRFAPADPLESTINRLFALDCQYQSHPTQISALEFAPLTATQLANNEHLLQQVFALLVLAHYQTSVNDLRQLLDTPNQHLYVLKQGDYIAAACLVSIEGGLTEELSKQIVLGQRRPRGHLLAQQLSAIRGETCWNTSLIARIVRIAVDPNCQAKGLGTALLNQVEAQLAKDIRFIGSSFGGNAELLSFWQANHFHTIKLGFKQDKVSGEHAVLVLKSRDRAYDQKVLALAQQFFDNLPYQLLTYFKHLDSDLVLSLLNAHARLAPTQQDKTSTLLKKHFSTAELQPLIWQRVYANPTCLKLLTLKQQGLVVKYVLQGWQLNELYNAQLNFSKKQVELELNEIAQHFFC
jgi:tRNA(Met) cytidine acetyltransferase